MLGPPKSRRLAEPITVSLEALVPRDHFYRHLEAKLDLSFVRDWTRALYAERGRPSIDPVVFFKLHLVMFFEGIRSERKLIETASLNLAHRWYLGYALDEGLPDHSSLTRIRRRLGIGIFERFFEQVVVGRLPIEINAEGVLTGDDPPWRLLEERRLDPKRPSHRGYQRTSDFRVSPTDPDASPTWDWGAIRLGYHDHYVVDGGKRRIILAALVTPADVMESQAMRDLLWRVCFRRHIWPHHVTGDAKYGTTENIVAIEDAGIRAYVPLTDFEHRSALYGRDAFTYDAADDTYHCPQGHPLPLARSKRTEAVVVYRAAPVICNACPVKGKCTTSDCGRTIQRSIYESYLEKVRSYHATEPYKKAIRKRQVWVEPLFAEAKEWHGLRRLRLRGLMNANIEGLLIAAGQNLKRLLAATGWDRRHAPSGSLLAVPREPWRLSVISR